MKYVFINVDDYYRFTWTIFLRTKNEIYEVLMFFAKQVQVKKNIKIGGIKSYKGT